MLRSTLRSCVLAAAGGAAATGAAVAYDYPTAERVNYVMVCMRDHPGPHFEMLNKCSCAIDSIARKVKLDDFVTMNTATDANTIGGERGSYLRDVEAVQAQIRKYRQIQAEAQKGCFIQQGAPAR